MRKLSLAQQAQLLDLLWDYLYDDLEHTDHRVTGYGTKTKDGLLESIEGIVLGD